MSQAQNDPLIGTMIREYEILELLGRGGMGSVYRARHIYLEEERAIKVIHARSTGQTSVDRFIREAKILTKLRHPNLVQLYEFGTLEKDSFFMVMELIRGDSVWQRIRKAGRFAPADAVRIIREAAAGLQCAHEKGIIHRDISPDNLILFRSNDRELTKIIDFGIAKSLIESSLELTGSNLFVGKPQYCSPEQCTFAQHKEPLDARSDIYSLAVTFYEMVTGVLPFYSKNPQGYFMKHVHDLPNPPSSHLPAGSFPEALDRVILKALSKKREERHAGIPEFLADLSAYEQQLTFPLFAEPEIGEIFAGRYHIEEKLGKGEMGMVFRAVDRILEIPVALKTISFDIADDKNRLARFKREVILARKVSHPNVCRVYDIGESGGMHYVSMELVEGKTLADTMRTHGPLPLEKALPIFKQLLFAIRETHREGIVHRDLKPQNVMIDRESRLKIMDFGISLSPDFSRITQTGSLVGTPHYMAPEIFEEKPVDQRADIYSLGVLMYAVLTGRLPFDGPTPIAVMYAHLKAEPVRPSDIVPSIPGELERIILRALEKRPEQRYENAEQILCDLESLSQPRKRKVRASERLTHRLIAEHRYARAIKILRAMLAEQPENLSWRRMLHNAIAEKTKRDLHRTKSLIRKGNFLQAELLLERFRASQLEVPGALNRIQKLQQILIARKTESVRSYLMDAQQRLEKKDYLAAMARLESAWHLQPNDPALVQMQEQIQLAQQKDTEREYQEKLDHASDLLSAGKDEQAFSIAEQILNENSAHQGARQLRDEILDKRWEQVQIKVRQELELAFQPLSFLDFEVAASLLKKLQAGLEIEPCRKEMERLISAITSIEEVFQKELYQDVPRCIQKLFARDPFGWLVPCEAVFDNIQKIANEKSGERQAIINNALTETRRLLEGGHFLEALSKLDEIPPRWSISDAEALRAEVLESFRAAKLESAQEFAADLSWEEALQCWKEVVAFFPEDENTNESISRAEEHLQRELELQQDLLCRLKECYSLVLKEQWLEAQELIEDTLKRIEPGFRLIEIERQIEALQSEILLHNHQQRKQQEARTAEIDTIRSLFKEGSYAEALERVSRILEMDDVQEQAVELKIAIEKAIQAQSIASRFQSAILKGKEFYAQNNWHKAIEYWKKAATLSDETYIREWIDEAQQQVKKERQARLAIIAMLAETEELIFHGRFVEARKNLNKCRKALVEKSYMTDLGEQLERLGVRLEEAIRKDQILHDTIQEDLENAALLYHQRLYVEAVRKLDAILDQQPEMEAAMQLKSRIEQEEGENRSVLEILRAIVKIVVKREFKQLSGMLIRLREVSSQTPYAEDCKSIIDEMPLLVLEIESDDPSAAKERLDRLFSRSLLLLEYQQTLTDFVINLGAKYRKEQDLSATLEDALKNVQSGDRQAVRGCLDRFQQIFRGTAQRKKKDPQVVERTASLSDDDMKLTESELEILEHALLHHEVESMLAAAGKLLEEGNAPAAQDLYLKALKMEPENAFAREALLNLEKLTAKPRRARRKE